MIEEVSCRVVTCDGCQTLMEGDGYILHFAPGEHLNLTDYEWHCDKTGFVRCARCIDALPDERRNAYGWPLEEGSDD